MEPSRTGAADARRVVLSTPTAPVDLTHCRSREPGLTDTHVVCYSVPHPNRRPYVRR